MTARLKFPTYAKIPLFLLGLYVFVDILYTTQSILLPLIYAGIIAISISPLVNILIRIKIPRTFAIMIVLIFVICAILGVFMWLSSQARLFNTALPQLTDKFNVVSEDALNWVSTHLDISKLKIDLWLKHMREEVFNNSGAAIGSTLTTVGSVLSVLFLTPVYIFMVLLYQSHLITFVHKLFGANNDNDVSEIFLKIKTIVQGYLVGLFTEFAIVSALNAICLLILGIDYAILLGIIGALLNIIPYIGGIMAIFLFMLIAFVTKTPIYVFYVFVLYMTIQFTDNHYIIPKIIGSKVKLNALICLIAVICGAALWGIPGMFLSIPLTAIVKVICERVSSLNALGFLLSDESEQNAPFKFDFKKLSSKFPRILPPRAN